VGHLNPVQEQLLEQDVGDLGDNHRLLFYQVLGVGWPVKH
jgi:hypothetical protein